MFLPRTVWTTHTRRLNAKMSGQQWCTVPLCHQSDRMFSGLPRLRAVLLLCGMCQCVDIKLYLDSCCLFMLLPRTASLETTWDMNVNIININKVILIYSKHLQHIPCWLAVSDVVKP